MKAGSRALRCQVIDSQLVDDLDKVSTLAGLLQVPCRSLKLTKLFSTETDGWNAAGPFHACCDGQGSTITLVQRADHHYYGGYASKSWTKNGHIQDAEAFLFRFRKDALKTVVEKFKSSGRGNELYGGKSYGPVFGTQHDLFTFAKDGHSSMLQDFGYGGHTSFELPDSLIDNSMPRTDGNFRLEVLKVGTTDNAEPAGALEEAWLPHVSWLQQVITYKPNLKRRSQPQHCESPVCRNVHHACVSQCNTTDAQSSVVCPSLHECVKCKINNINFRRPKPGIGTSSHDYVHMNPRRFRNMSSC